VLFDSNCQGEMLMGVCNEFHTQDDFGGEQV